jgi:C-terminal processing protease CtpA/Prc
LFFAAMTGDAEPTNTAPNFDEVYQLLRTNLEGVSKTDLDREAVKGLLNQLPGQAMIVRAEAADTNASSSSALSDVAVYDEAYAYIRIGTVEGAVAAKFRAAYEGILQTNKAKLKGIVLDLRFARGADYKAAAALADCFLNSDQMLLDWGAGSANATRKSNAITVPVAILVNAKTSGAAEAVAAALREADTGLILGGTTAGQANIFKEFPLQNGEKLRVATSPIKLGDGSVLAHGVKPDVAVDVTLDDERAYLDDPYKILHAPPVAKNASNTNSAAAQAFHRPNEAELVREKRAGEMADEDSSDDVEKPAVAETPPPSVIADPALARALDLLKGLAVIQLSHPG